MKIIQICPGCGLPGIKVDEMAVKYNLKKPAKAEQDVKHKWSACINPGCECSYFTAGKAFDTSDLVKPLFYKDKSDDVPICYCSDLTRGEIKNAVRKGCQSISEVQKFTKKNITGKCEKRNPLGKCCKQVFLRTIKEEIKSKPSDKHKVTEN
jgi:bacterioferritin-associated ferredoxin